MIVAASPQSKTVGEPNSKATYASLMNANPIVATKTTLKSIQLIHGEPTIQFTFKELDEYAVEAGLHQAVIMKLSYGAPSLHELRKLIPKQLAIKGRCLIGSLTTRHLLIRCDLYEDFCSVLSKQFGYLHFNGEQHLFRNFPWTQNFNPKEETSKALAWVSLPDLPLNLFARRPLLSIASAIGKPVAIDKATQDRTRPSTARVKVILDLLDKHSKRVRMHFLDEQSGKLIEHYQQVVFDNLLLYCTCCKHQGHEDADCRLMIKKNKWGEGHQDGIGQQRDKTNNVEQLQGDARDFLNSKKAENKVSNDKNNNASNVKETPKINSGLVDRTLVQEGPLAPGESLDNALENSDEVQGYKEGDTYLIVDEEKPDSNVNHVLDRNSIATSELKNSGQQTHQFEVGQQLNGNVTEQESVTATGIASVGNELATTSHDNVEPETSISKVSIVASQVSSGKLPSESVATSSEQKGVTSESQWADQVKEHDEHVTPQRKLSPEAPIFVPKGSGICRDSSSLEVRQLVLPGTNFQKHGDKEPVDALVTSSIKEVTLLTPINTNKQLQDGGGSSSFANRFANLQDEDTFEEDEEEEMLNYCFENAAREADISPRQYRNNKKHERKNSWDGKVTGGFVPRHLPMRLAKKNHMTVPTTSRFNKSK